MVVTPSVPSLARDGSWFHRPSTLLLHLDINIAHHRTLFPNVRYYSLPSALPLTSDSRCPRLGIGNAMKERTHRG
jgi:hypothetical protein